MLTALQTMNPSVAIALLVSIVSVTYIISESLHAMWRIYMRHANIREHGWPPEHMDADGDNLKAQNSAYASSDSETF